MADDKHMVRLAQCHILVRRGEIIGGRLWVDLLPLEDVLRGDAVKVSLQKGEGLRLLAENLIEAQGGTDVKIVLKHVFQGWLVFTVSQLLSSLFIGLVLKPHKISRHRTWLAITRSVHTKIHTRETHTVVKTDHFDR